ncbi:MAG: DNA polymerase IV, partial [candidate division NC10 bacterium]|nr:DNA polymerase IV [candidate division NC10 bacterium]
VHSAMPMGQALRLCPHALRTPPNFSLYSEYAGRVMEIIRSYGCPMEQVSVDEVFLDLTGARRLWKDPLSLASDLKRRIQEEVGLPCTIGIAANKLVAKVASNQGKPNGLLQVPPGEEAGFLAPLSVERLWGVGPKCAARLKMLGIHTVGQLQQAPLELLKHQFRKWALDLQRRANGQDTRPLETEHAVKSISRERTFVQDLADLNQLKRTLLSLCEGAGHDLRGEGLLARTIAIKLRWPNFQTITRQTTLPQPTDSTSQIYQAAASLLETTLKPGIRVRLLGVRAANLMGGQQLALFQSTGQRRSRLDTAVDSIRERFGEEAIRRASLVPDREG